MNLTRAKGTESIIPFIKGKGITDNRVSRFSTLEVASVEENYVLMKSGEDTRIGSICGIGCTLGRDLRMLEGGILHYPFGGTYLASMYSVKLGDSVKLGLIILGKMVRLLKNLALFKRIPLKLLK